MSIQAVSWVLEQTISDPVGKLVMISLANAYNGKSGRCFPSIDQISQETSCSRSTVKRKLQWLSDAGWIAIHNSFDGHGRQLANSYSICFENDEGEGSNLNPRQATGEPGEGFNCEPPLKEPEEIPENIMSETSSDTSPSKPKPKPKPKTKRNSYPPEFEEVWKTYPTDPLMSKKEAFDAWKKLDDADKAALRTAIPVFVAYCKKNTDYRPIHMCRFIKYRRFDGFAESAPVEDDGLWMRRLAHARRTGLWSKAKWGPMPGETGCRCPQRLIEAGDGQNWEEWEIAA